MESIICKKIEFNNGSTVILKFDENSRLSKIVIKGYVTKLALVNEINKVMP